MESPCVTDAAHAGRRAERARPAGSARGLTLESKAEFSFVVWNAVRENGALEARNDSADQRSVGR